jgi:hypothetical protein
MYEFNVKRDVVKIQNKPVKCIAIKAKEKAKEDDREREGLANRLLIYVGIIVKRHCQKLKGAGGGTTEGAKRGKKRDLH